MNRGKEFITANGINININAVVKESYVWALDYNPDGLLESYQTACLKRPDLKSVSQSSSEHELFLNHSRNGTPDGSWKTVVQREDGRISAVLVLSEGTLYADILHTDGEFRLLRWHF